MTFPEQFPHLIAFTHCCCVEKYHNVGLVENKGTFDAISSKSHVNTDCASPPALTNHYQFK